MNWDNQERTALLLGFVIGGISVILREIDTNDCDIKQVKANLNRLLEEAMEHVDNQIYNNYKENNDHYNCK